METPTGSVGIPFVPANDFGVLDHVVTLPDGQSVLKRVVTNGDGSEVMFTLFQHPEMSDEFARDAGMVEADLRTLRSVGDGSVAGKQGTWIPMARTTPHSIKAETPVTMLLTLLK
ncbi:MAG: hypothetical protein WD049_09085 [Candidatus Paceibacterota bacterium]